MCRKCYVFYQNCRKVEQINQKLWANKCHFWPKWPFWGILALKVPGEREVDFSEGKCYLFHNKNICLHILTKFQKNWMDGSKVIVKKVSFWLFLPILGLFDPFWAPRALTRFFFKNRRMSLFNLSEVTTSCKISDNFNGWPRRKIQTNGQTDRPQNYSPPPISRVTKNVKRKNGKT